MNKLTHEFVEKAINNLGGVLLSKYKAAKDKLIVKCLKDNYIWFPTFSNIKKGRWCPKCAKHILKSFEEIKCFVTKKNGKILSKKEELKNAQSKLKIQCENGHKWSTSYRCLMINKSWCPGCAGFILKTFKEVKAFVKNKGGVVISKKKDLKNNKSYISIVCKNKHNFDIAYYNLLYGNRWCPECSLGKTQNELKNILEGILNKKAIINFKGFDWMKDKNKLEIDIWFPDIKLAVEYDGLHHFEPITYGGSIKKAKERLEYRKSKDKLKNNLIAEHKKEIKYFIRFNCYEEINRDNVIKKLKEYNIIKRKDAHEVCI